MTKAFRLALPWTNKEIWLFQRGLCRNRTSGWQQRRLEQHQSTRLRSGRGYSRLHSVLPAQGRFWWHICSCWLRQEGEGHLSGTDVLLRREEIRVPSAKPPASAPCGSRRLRRCAGHARDAVSGGAPAWESKCHGRKMQNWFNINCWLKVV